MDLIEAYYAVAKHLHEQADRRREVAEMLGFLADSMSEQPSGCTRSHPHENMNTECERLTEIARSGVTRPAPP